MLLDLVDLGVHSPFTHVVVAPLARHDDVAMAPIGQPSREEFLRPSVRTRHVHPPNPFGVGGVKHLVRHLAHGRHVAAGRQYRCPAQVDVSRSSDRREAYSRPCECGHSCTVIARPAPGERTKASKASWYRSLYAFGAATH